VGVSQALGDTEGARASLAAAAAIPFIGPLAKVLRAVDRMGEGDGRGRTAPPPRNPNVYEVFFEAPITGASRSAHRSSANQYLANQLGQNADLAAAFNRELGTDVLGHMHSGKNLINPPGMVWHHPANNPGVMQLLRAGEHTNPSVQSILHPSGVGGFGNFYGP
jgi:hypothetical protein